MDVQLPNGVIVKNVPEGTTKAQLMARVAKAGQKPAAPAPKETGDSALETFVRGAAQGATFNLADEFAAGMDALTQPLLGRGSDAKTLSERYGANLKTERSRDLQNYENHPIASVTGNLTGAVAGPGKFMNGAKGAIDMIKQGAAAGAIYGFGQGEGGLPERLESATEGAAIGAATGGAFSGATKIINKVRPANVGAKFVNKAFEKSPVAAESEQIAKDIGQTYTPGQATGSKGLLTIEGLVRRHPASADKMAEFDAKQLSVSLNNLTQNLDRLHANPAGPEATGNLVSKAFDKVLDSAVKVRRRTADTDFGAVDSAAGTQKIIPTKNLSQTIDDIAADFAAPGGGDASASLVRQIQGIKKELAAGNLTAKETGRLLEIYGKAAKGTGAVFKDMDTAQQRMIAGRLQRALESDLDEAADAGGDAGGVATLLKTARDNYRQNSKAINELEKSVLGRLFGGNYEKAPEKVAQAMRNMQPSELRQSLGILSKADPATSQSVKRFLVEDAMRAAEGAAPGAPKPQVGGEVQFSAPKFLTAIRKSPVWGGLEPGERKGLEMAVRDLERIAYRGGTEGSPTAPLLFAWEVAKAMGGGVAAMSPTQLAKSTAAVLVPGKIAKVITTPDGQKALRTLRIAKPNTPAAMAATSALVGMFVEDEKHAAQK